MFYNNHFIVVREIYICSGILCQDTNVITLGFKANHLALLSKLNTDQPTTRPPARPSSEEIKKSTKAETKPQSPLNGLS